MPRKFHGIEDYADLGQAVIVQLVNLVEDSTLSDKLRNCAGIACFDAVKVAGLLSFQRGHGFVISKLGTTQWGPPVFLDMNLGGIGFSFGWQSFQTLIIIPSKQLLNEFVSGKFKLQGDMALDLYIAGENTAQARTPRNASDSNSTQVYHISHGSMVDVSLVGGIIAPSEEAMTKYYGKEWDPLTLLKADAGEVPKEMKQFYEQLGSVAQ